MSVYMTLNDEQAERLAKDLRDLLKEIVLSERVRRPVDESVTEKVYVAAMCLTCDLVALMTGVADDVEDELLQEASDDGR